MNRNAHQNSRTFTPKKISEPVTTARVPIRSETRP